jgi:hypothetical protein
MAGTHTNVPSIISPVGNRLAPNRAHSSDMPAPDGLPMVYFSLVRARYHTHTYRGSGNEINFWRLPLSISLALHSGGTVRLLRQFLSCLGMLYCALASGDISISGLDPISINAWAGATSDLTGTDTYCTVSCQGACDKDVHRRDYAPAFYTNGTTDGAGNFYITNGSHSLTVFLDWTHPVSGTTRMTNHNVTGMRSPVSEGAYSCSADPNSTTRIDITLPAGQIASAQAGTYSETFLVDSCRTSGQGFGECTAHISFSVTLPELIQVTNLTNIDLGSWSGTGDIQVTRDFCVFRNGQGGFAITTSGNHDASGRFHLGSSGNLPYRIDYGQGGVFKQATPGVSMPFSSSGFTGNSVRDCTNSGGANTSIRLTVLETDLAIQPGGSFADTVNIFVLPE